MPASDVDMVDSGPIGQLETGDRRRHPLRASRRAGSIHIDFRLPATSETYGVAETRDNFYGISYKVRQPQDLDMAEQLLRDALARES